MSKKPLKCPLKAEGTRDKTESYGSFLNNVHTFRGMDMLPVVLDFGEHVTVDDLVQNRGAWHKSCYVKFSKEKLERVIKKRSRHDSAEYSSFEKKGPRRKLVDKMACLFCQQGGHLHKFTTFESDESVRQIATELRETELMARMEGGDLIALEAKYQLQCLTALRNHFQSLVHKNEQEVGGSSEEVK